jgi:peptide/nickel transport system ATP-binding protein
VPRLGETRSKRKLIPINGTPPNLIDMPATCAFLPRCGYHLAQCEQEPWPELRQIGRDHYIACFAEIQEKK